LIEGISLKRKRKNPSLALQAGGLFSKDRDGATAGKKNAPPACHGPTAVLQYQARACLGVGDWDDELAAQRCLHFRAALFIVPSA
jgi:hypothetical protein